jgi:hypothetical protein
MEKKIIQVFFVVAISIFILVSQTYSHYYILTEADFLSPNLRFESPDQEILPITKQTETKIFTSGGSPFLVPAQAVFAAPAYNFIFTLCSHDQETFVLRC